MPLIQRLGYVDVRQVMQEYNKSIRLFSEDAYALNLMWSCGSFRVNGNCWKISWTDDHTGDMFGFTTDKRKAKEAKETGNDITTYLLPDGAPEDQSPTKIFHEFVDDIKVEQVEHWFGGWSPKSTNDDDKYIGTTTNGKP